MAPSYKSFSITPSLQDTLRTAFEDIPFSPYKDADKFKFLDSSLDATSHLLPTEIKEAIREMDRSFTDEGILLIKGLPIDTDIAKGRVRTPSTDSPVDNRASFISEAVITGIGQMLGNIFGYQNEKRGEFIHNISPKYGASDRVSSDGAALPFPFHVENLNLFPLTPSFIALLCLRADRDQIAITYGLNPKREIQRLDADDIATLRTYSFLTKGNDSIGIKDARKLCHPVLLGEMASPYILYEGKDTVGITAEARKALAALTELIDCSRNKIEIKFEVGDMLIIDNRRVLHSRNAFTAYGDGFDRWLQRIYIKTAPWYDWHKYLTGKPPYVINDMKI